MNINLKKQLRLLVQLAAADMQLDDREKVWLHSIGESNGLTSSDVEEIINKCETEDLSGMGFEERFEFLLNTINLMKQDRKRYFKQINFCKRTAERLGFKTNIVNELSMSIYNERLLARSLEDVRYNVKKYILS